MRICISALFILLFFNVNAHNPDIDLLRDINLHRDKSLDGTMKAFTTYDYPVSIAIPVTELIVGLARRDGKVFLDGMQTVVALGANAFVSYGLKYSINRSRPNVMYPDIQAYRNYTDHSFPSGHASFAFCSATSISLCYPRWFVIVPSYLWATTVSYSRLHLGVHYPTDVLAGAVIGAGSAWLSHKANRWYHRKKYKEMFPEPM